MVGIELKSHNDWKRLVIKIGTNSIMKDVDQVDFKKLDRLAFVCSSLVQEGYQVSIISSGAVGVGASIMDIHEYPTDIHEQQALAAIGQSALMGHYSRFFNYYNRNVAQILLTKDVFEFSKSYENVKNTIFNLLARGVIPIMNENDSISIEELEHVTKFGENDTLAAIVAENINADLLIILSDVDGLYNKNPRDYPDAKRLSHISEITDDVRAMATGKGSEFATGGMSTKINAAERMLKNDASMIIADSEDPLVIFKILMGNDVGTLFSRVVERRRR
ncbi:glutamate 5-kinase [Aerococcaceae bacterium DSM 111020]|nr:glutamate 5-kinase [Aerococcaceae bacterium DSM 111020]